MMLKFREALHRMLETRVLVLAALGSGDGIKETYQQLMSNVFPFLDPDTQKQNMREELEKMVSKGVFKIRPLATPGEVRKLRSRLRSQDIKRDQTKIKRGLTRYLDMD